MKMVGVFYVRKTCNRPRSYVDVVRAISEAVGLVAAGKHDPYEAHERIKTFYDWAQIAVRTEKVYDAVMASPQMELVERMQR